MSARGPYSRTKPLRKRAADRLAEAARYSSVPWTQRCHIPVHDGRAVIDPRLQEEKEYL